MSKIVYISGRPYEVTFENATKIAGLKCSVERPDLSGHRRRNYITRISRSWRGCSSQKRQKLLRQNVEIQRNCCAWCRTPFSKDRFATLEHLVALADRGETTLKNTIAICEPCRRDDHKAMMERRNAGLLEAAE